MSAPRLPPGWRVINGWTPPAYYTKIGGVVIGRGAQTIVGRGVTEVEAWADAVRKAEGLL